MKRIFLVANVPTPYRLPLFNEIARQLADIGVSLKVLFSAAGYARREWTIDWSSAKFEYQILNGRAINLGSHEKYMFTYPGLMRLVCEEKPALVLTGGYSIATMLLRITKIWTKIPFVIWSEENRRRSAIRQTFRRLLVVGASGFIASGSEAKRYLESLGAKTDRIWIAINTVDIDYFGRQFRRRDKLTGDNKHVLLCISALVPQKRLDTILHVSAALANRRSDFTVLVVGSGPERQKLEALAQQLGVGNIVHFTGYLQQQQIADALHRASCFLFPSTYDVWGMVLVEAMAAGVPSISSVHSGATEDLIQDGITGYAVDFLQTEEVCARIERILDDPDHAYALGVAARNLVTQRATLAASAEGVVTAVRCLIADSKENNISRYQSVSKS